MSSGPARLRYTGSHATTFTEAGHVEPGGEFSVPADRARGYLRRADVEHAGECPAPPCKCGEEPEPELEVPAGNTGRRGRRGTPGGDAVN